MDGVGQTEVEFLLNIQKLLSEGLFTATYKFALLTALADLSVELGHDDERQLEISDYQIAGKFIEYYWSHSMPFRDSALRQSTGKPAAIISRLEAARGQFPTLYSLRRGPAWNSVVGDVARTVREQPLWKLQTIRSGSLEFIYRNDIGARTITLLPNVCRSFRLFHGLITDVVRGAWVDFVRKLPGNRAAIGNHCDLEQFLFGETRNSLTALRRPLRDIQDGRCFYCRRNLTDTADVDHFIPWVIYRRDLGHNFVLADRKCNSSKSSMLAGFDHLSAWVRRNNKLSGELSARFDRAGVVHDLETTVKVARHAYNQASMTGGSLWVNNRFVEPAGDSWRAVFGET